MSIFRKFCFVITAGLFLSTLCADDSSQNDNYMRYTLSLPKVNCELFQPKTSLKRPGVIILTSPTDKDYSISVAHAQKLVQNEIDVIVLTITKNSTKPTALADIQKVLKILLNLPHVDKTKIGLLGYSNTSQITTQAAGLNKNISHLCNFIKEKKLDNKFNGQYIEFDEKIKIDCLEYISSFFWITDSNHLPEFNSYTASRRAMRTFRMLRKSTRLCAHRGGRGDWPEETLTAYKLTHSRWPGMLLEADALLTSDGHVVFNHDLITARVSNGKVTVPKTTLAALKKFDAGYNFTPDNGKTFPWRGKGVKFTTLEEVLTTLPDACFEIEIKGFSDIAKATIDTIRKHNAQDRVILASFFPNTMAFMRKYAPVIPRSYGPVSGMQLKKVLADEKLWKNYKPVDDIVSMTINTERSMKFTQEEITRIRKKGIWMQIHTVNDLKSLNRFKSLGYDSIMTDYPTRFFK